jgi:hypothetical protein
MSQIAMTNEERTRAIIRFGYTEREAGFLCLAALHGGYFVRRQYGEFLEREDGGTITQLVEKALSKGHAKVSTFSKNARVYHLCARPFYEVLGQVDNRNRRERQPLSIKSRLMGLDFVLAHRTFSYLATEQEKVDYFTVTLKIAPGELPAKVYTSAKTGATTIRHFIDKYPIYLAAPVAHGASPVVSFCYIDEGTATLSRFETYLCQYSRLFACLPRFELVYVAAGEAITRGAAGAFARCMERHRNGQGTGIDPKIRRMLDHFSARHRYESRDFGSFDRAGLLRLREDQEEFSGTEIQVLYDRWKADGDGAVLDLVAPERPAGPQICGTFSTCLLEHSYDLFGSLTAF